MIVPQGWRVELETVGYLGKHRDAKFAEWTSEYGEWMFGWRFGDVMLDFLGVCQVYEDAYQHFLWFHPHVAEQLVAEASDVYDDDPSNILSGLDYLEQETSRTHIQDIAIRRNLVRLGAKFEGDKPIRIRQELGEHPLSMTLSPGKVPFHMPSLIGRPQLEGWWDPDSVESFYQTNRVLLVREKYLRMDVIIDPRLEENDFRLEMR